MPTFWLSFAPPVDHGPGRVAMIDADSERDASLKAHILGLVNRGDETLILEMPEDAEELALPRNRILTVEELKSVGAQLLGNVDGSN